MDLLKADYYPLSEEEKKELKSILEKIDSIDLTKEQKADVQRALADFRSIESKKIGLDKRIKEMSNKTIEDHISYKSPANIPLDVRVTSGKRMSQPERDTMHFNEFQEYLVEYGRKVAELENILRSAINLAASTATLSNRGRLKKELERNLIKYVPTGLIKYHAKEFAKYRKRALIIAAINLNYLSADILES